MLSPKILLIFIFLISIIGTRLLFITNPLTTRFIESYDLINDGRLKNWLLAYQYGSSNFLKGIGILKYFEIYFNFTFKL